MAFTDHSGPFAAMHENGINAPTASSCWQAEAKDPGGSGLLLGAALKHERNHRRRRAATATHQSGARQLRRSGDDKMLGGVADGIARYLNADVTLVRVIIAALALLTGAGAALYIVAWLLIPADGEDQPVAAAWIADSPDRFR